MVISTGTLDATTDYLKIKVNPPLDIGPLEGLAKAVEVRDVSLESGQKELKKEAEIVIPYTDKAPRDGIIDGTNIKEDDLEV